MKILTLVLLFCISHGLCCFPKSQKSKVESTTASNMRSGTRHEASCVSRCGAPSNRAFSCQCNVACQSFGDCCSDFETECLSCHSRCGEKFRRSRPCHCSDNCSRFGNCCSDYAKVCQTQRRKDRLPTTEELEAFSENLLQHDINNVANQIVLDHQGRTSSSSTEDKAPEPLFSSVSPTVFQGSTISLLKKLRDNYEPAVQKEEEILQEEKAEELKFLNAVMETEIMNRTEKFLKQYEGLLDGNLKEYIKKVWFKVYSRWGTALGSSGFEHVFIGEWKNNNVGGFHNWLNFYEEEKEKDIDYKGWIKQIDLGNKGEILGVRFDWQSNQKPVGSMFIGTSPELELALYTVCFKVMPDKKCPVKMNGHRFKVQTWTKQYKGQAYVSTAYPDI